MKFKLLIPFIITLLLVIPIFAEESEGLSDNIKGNIQPKTTIFNKIAKIFSTQQTVIDGALCSTYPDWQKQSILNQNRICWINRNGGSPGGRGVEHTGVAYLVYMWDNVGQRYNLLREVKVRAGQKGCVNLPRRNEHYLREAYYCDEEAHGCTDRDRFRSICHTVTRTKRQRQCLGNDVETVWVGYVDWSVPWCEGTQPSSCSKRCSGAFYLDRQACECICGLSPNDCSNNQYLDTDECECVDSPTPSPSPTSTPSTTPEQCQLTEGDCSDNQYLDLDLCACIDAGNPPQDCNLTCDDNEYLDNVNCICMPSSSCNLICPDGTTLNENYCICETFSNNKDNNILSNKELYILLGTVIIIVLIILLTRKK